MPVSCSCTCWTFGNSWKGPMKYGLPFLPSWHLSDLGIESLDFSEFWLVLETLMKLCVTKIGEMGQK